MLRVGLVASVGFVCLALFACSASDDGEDVAGDEGLGADALTTSGTCDRGTIQQAVSGDRGTILDRGFAWLDAKVPYNQNRQYQSYRTDCSGFVSMAWQLGTSQTTATLINEPAVGAYSNLLPGDALVYRSGGSGHAILFTGWKDSSKTSACILHEAGTTTGMKFGAWTTANLQSSGYKAIRKPGLGATAPPASTAQQAPPASTGTDSGNCLPTNGVCNGDSECCSQSCSNHRCSDLPVPPLPPADTSSSSSSSGDTPPPVVCGSEGSGCIVDTNCCVGSCIDGQCSSTGCTADDLICEG